MRSAKSPLGKRKNLINSQFLKRIQGYVLQKGRKEGIAEARMQEKIIKRLHGIENVFLINLSIDKRGA